jgi:glutaredoxin
MSLQRWIRPALIAAAAYVLLLAIKSHSDEQAGAVLVGLAKPGDIVMLSSETCRYCKSANRFMTERRIPFSECFIERDAACAERYRAHKSPGTPVLLVRGQPQLGFDAAAVAQALGAN